MNSIMVIISVIVVIGICAFFFLKVVKPLKSSGRAGMQNQAMRKCVDDYSRLARKLRCPPPVVPEAGGGRRGWPVLTIKNKTGTILVTPTIDYWGEHEQSILYRSPYTEMSATQRIQEADMEQAAQSFLEAATDVMGASYHHQQHQIRSCLLTTVRLTMPASWKGSMILVRPATFLGKLIGLNEVVISHPGFDKKLNVNGANADRIREMLTPQLCEALLRFTEKAGAFQLNESHLLCAFEGLDTDKVPAIVNEMWAIAKIAGK